MEAHKVKTFLFKMTGAWSPLWNLSQEKFFELKEQSIEYFSCSISESIMEFQQQLQKQIYTALQNYGSKHADSIVFSEYQDTTSWNPDFGKDSELLIESMERARQIFGDSMLQYQNREQFVRMSICGIPFVVLNKGNGKFEFRK